MDVADMESKIVVLVEPVEHNGQLRNFCTM